MLTATLPLQMIDDAGLNVRAVHGGHGLRIPRVGGDHHAGVGPEIDVGPAWRPNDRSSDEGIGDQVVAIDRARKAPAITGADTPRKEVLDVELR